MIKPLYVVKVLCVEIDPRLKRANCQEKFFARFTLPYGNYNLDGGGGLSYGTSFNVKPRFAQARLKFPAAFLEKFGRRAQPFGDFAVIHKPTPAVSPFFPRPRAVKKNPTAIFRVKILKIG
jgi:hypothetical protein